MSRRRRYDDHENHEAWAIPYGDLVTLLLAFFVVMYAISSVNEGKYRVLSDSLTEAFHGTPRSPQPIEAGGTQPQPSGQLPLTQVRRMIDASLPIRHVASETNTPPASPQSRTAASPANESSGDAAVARQPGGIDMGSIDVGGLDIPGSDLEQVARDVSAALSSLVADGHVRVRRTESWVEVDISTDILFGSGVARLSPAALAALQRLADVLKTFPNAVRVEGHTDDRPIDTAAFPSNWELSAARAASVVHLFMDRGMAAQRLAVVGYGEFRPMMSNNTIPGRNANRRVEVLIFSRDASADGLR
jgi:chemotaxis protein MotB